MHLLKIRNKNLSGFTLLEIMVALCMILLVWGAASTLLLKMRLSLKEVLTQDPSEGLRNVVQILEREIAFPLEPFEGDSKNLVFQKASGKTKYAYERGSLYLLDTLSPGKKILLNHLEESDWSFWIQDQWVEECHEGEKPQAIRWSISSENSL
ncbi:MAG: prepilin-type N-terminal cleavage/methylation domain-containing protein [Chlamydiae bacterium]|nr:prepilin-type N-terminal cleavage/methylation domain-containing protein [Chlamydiota bacterium]